MAPYPYHNLEESIKKILKENVTVNDEEKKKINEHLKQICDVLESEMKKDPAFDELFGQKQYVGSYYENLKIEMPDEFDINFELHIESYIGHLEICSSEKPGFCQLKLNENTSPVSDTGKTKAKELVKKWTDDEGFLSRYEVNKWMQSIVNKAVGKYKGSNEEKIYEVKSSCHGPAVTLTVIFTDTTERRFSIDFVPVFVFDTWPNIENLREWETEMKEKKWYAVPKSDDCDRDFRLSFWHQEKHLLSDTNQMKPVLKLIKKLRNIQQWNGISSYYIKTMFLWKTAANGKSYWQKGLGETFIEMLEEMKDCLLEPKSLQFFWVKGNDLLSKLNADEKNNIGGYLKNMLAKIKNNLDVPGFLERYFSLHARLESSEADVGDEDSGGEDSVDVDAGDEDFGDEDFRDHTPTVSRTVNHNSRLHTHRQQDNTGTAVAIAVGVGVAALAVGVFAHLFSNRRRARE